MDKPKAGLSSFTLNVGGSLFVFEPDQVRIFGVDGSEAAVPLEDLKALLDHLDDLDEAPPPNPGTSGLPGEELD